MNVNPTGSTSISTTGAQLFKAFDTNGDNQLSSNEFLTLLNRLASLVSASGAGKLDGPLATQSSPAATQVQPRASSAPTVYQPMMGFDTRKLNDLTHNTPKYVFARATQDLGLPDGNRAAMSATLPQVVEYVKSHGFPSARQMDDDEIDFGDGFGSVDVITFSGSWWWGPTT